ncbi:YqhG family protein [Paenibacillus sp. MBLB4367]|uniref:YqhG family protein n=1 Tax=Paenibacillus sp. MBLB4367 TaxID=3384767 RepID=UPI0039082554
MNAKQVQKYVMRYLEATDCQIIEKGAAHVTVKLSVEADKALTNRHYYWGFVERTGAPPETMAYTFVFDPEKMNAAADKSAQAQAQSQTPPKTGVYPAARPTVGAASAPSGTAAAAPGAAPGGQSQDSILGRYFGIVPPSPTGRIPREEVGFGSRRLEQLFAAAQSRGRFVRLFEQPASQRAANTAEPAGTGTRLTTAGKPDRSGYGLAHTGYSTWLGVNFKVELACDLKRDELHSLGIDLASGEIIEHFMPHMLEKKLSPKLPANIFLQPTKISLNRAATILENSLFAKLKALDHGWADSATERLQEELTRIDDYYVDLLQSLEAEQKEEAEAQYLKRQQEIEWQHRPRIQVSVINCGLFHLEAAPAPRADAAR